jgi:acetyl-CoA synthetase
MRFQASGGSFPGKVKKPGKRAVQKDLSRLLKPASIAIVGGGVWCRNLLRQLALIGYAGVIWRVHPEAAPVEGVPAVASLADLPRPPDAVFVGINREATVRAVAELAAMGAGGAVCFASGFSEAQAEDAGSADMQARLISAAGAMPILGPNCYGFINAFDRALLWPDQHGCRPVATGVAILTQSSNIAINLTMQARALPIGFVAACGNMAQVSQARLALALLEDPRVTAIGLHVEGFGDPVEWHALALKAWEKRVPLVVLKVGATAEAQAAALSHTASLVGTDGGARALLAYLGVPRVSDLASFLEVLKLLHVHGRLESAAVSAICCSGGEASLIADLAVGTRVTYPALTEAQTSALRSALGPRVALANPLDYHTYIWGDLPRMVAAWRPMAEGEAAITLVVVDYPRTDARDWRPATDAALTIARESGRAVAVVASLPELMPEDTAQELLEGGVVPLSGMREALAAVEAAATQGPPNPLPPALSRPDANTELVREDAAKALLRAWGIRIPAGLVADRRSLAVSAGDLKPPFALKLLGLAHKTEAGGVRLNLSAAELVAAAACMPGEVFLLEEMVAEPIAELLLGITSDPGHGLVMTLGAGGVHTEIWADTAHLLLPVTAEEVEAALMRLRIAPVLRGYRGKAGASVPAIVEAALALQRCVLEAKPEIVEAEINPLMCPADAAVAADALIRRVRAERKSP